MGQVFSGGGSRPVTAEELQSVQRMQKELTRLPVPPLIQKTFAMVAILALTACTHPGTTTTPPVQENDAMTKTAQQPPTPPVVTSGELAPLGDPAIRAQLNIKPVEWPLWFKSHKFGARCYDTLTCEVLYDGFLHGNPKPSPPSATYGPDYLKGWDGIHWGLNNFPSPAQVRWRSKDGSWHEAEIDIGALFQDELVRHHVPREEVADAPDGKYDDDPSILLEVCDRTIRVYMSAHIGTKHFQKPGNRYSDFRHDLILVKTHTY